MTAPEPKRLDYAAHESRQTRRFEMRPAGWVVLAFLAVAVLTETWRWLR